MADRPLALGGWATHADFSDGRVVRVLAIERTVVAVQLGHGWPSARWLNSPLQRGTLARFPVHQLRPAADS